jgi:thioredoxin reductase (NADPH)
METYDLAIIGAGPAGLSASVYASRYGIGHIVIGEVAGGLTTQTFEIGNWLGTENIGGQEFADKAAAHVRSYGVEIRPATVSTVEKRDGGFRVLFADGKELRTKTVLAATGTHHRHLGVPGETEFAGKGVSYCPTCDGFFFKNRTVAVVGGGDSAAEAATYLANVCRKVYVIVRGKELRAEKFWRDLLSKRENVEVVYETNVREIRGQSKVEELLLDRPYQGNSILNAEGVFVEIGLLPNTGLLDTLGVGKDEYGYVKVSPGQETTVEGVWAAGDATTGSNRFRQIVTAAAEGAVAANGILQYLQRGE